jgi:hypothetical protein
MTKRRKNLKRGSPVTRDDIASRMKDSRGLSIYCIFVVRVQNRDGLSHKKEQGLEREVRDKQTYMSIARIKMRHPCYRGRE